MRAVWAVSAGMGFWVVVLLLLSLVSCFVVFS